MGNKSSGKLEYNDFLQLTKGKEKQQISSQQHLLQQYQCTILKHNNKSIEGICMNEECKQQNRRTCFDCMIDKIHDKDHGKSAIIKNADQCEDIIQEFKIILNNQIDDILFQFYYEQLEFCDETNDHLAYIKYKELNKIDEQIKMTQQLIEELNFRKYLSEQQKNNIGLFQYLQSQQKQIIYISQLINEYLKLKSEVEQPKKFIQYFQVGQNDLEDIQAIRKKKKQIIQLIANTFNNNQLTINQKEYLIKNIRENIKDIQKSTDNSKQDLLINNYKFLFKLSHGDRFNFFCDDGIHSAFHAKDLLEKEQYQLAIFMYDQRIQDNPTKIEYYFEQGLAFECIQQYEQANLIYDKAKITKEEYYYHKGQALEQIKKYEQAILMYDQAIQINPKQFYYYFKARAFEQIQKYDQAILVYDQAIQIHPNDSSNYKYKGEAFEKIQKYEQAILMYDKAISIDPKDEYNYRYKIGALEKLQKYDQAILVYDKLIQIAPKYSHYYFDKGVALEKLQKYDQAILMYDKAFQIDSRLDLRYTRKGAALEKLQKYDQAILIYDKLIQSNPKHSHYHKYKGQALEKQQKYYQAILVYDQAIQIDPYYKDYYFYKGQALEKVQKFDQCILIYEKLIKLDPKNAEYYYHNGQALEKIQKYEQAILMYDQAIQLDSQQKYIQSRESAIMNQVKS